jgi:hypothetical protein
MPEIQKVPYFLERESQPLHLPDRAERFHIRFCVLSKATGGSWWSRDQRIALIEPDRIRRQPNLLRNAANMHRYTLLL